jgi:hypothetical protein
VVLKLSDAKENRVGAAVLYSTAAMRQRAGHHVRTGIRDENWLNGVDEAGCRLDYLEHYLLSCTFSFMLKMEEHV